jgi:FixJ family two-component response regulator
MDLHGPHAQAEVKGNYLVRLARHQGVENAVRAMKAGAVDFIEKPFDDTTLFAAIEGAFTRTKLSDRLPEAKEAARRIGRLSARSTFWMTTRPSAALSNNCLMRPAFAPSRSERRRRS